MRLRYSRNETRLSIGVAIVVPINTFAPEPFAPTRPILVSVEPFVSEEDGELEYIASLTEANIGASGDTVAEAVKNLKDRLIAKFDMLENMPADRLGKMPRRQLEILKSLIRRTR